MSCPAPTAGTPDRGLSPLGADFLRQLEACHICPDVSHISDPGFWDVVRLARGPVVATHSNSRALCPHRRNLTDDMFRAIRDSGGVVGLNLYRPFVGPAGTMEELVAHVEHFLELGGEKALCLGGDLDGCGTLAAGMQGVQDMPRLWAGPGSPGLSPGPAGGPVLEQSAEDGVKTDRRYYADRI